MLSIAPSGSPVIQEPSRRNTPRVKTGCKTCKRRKVKCDEKRPSCLKCTSTGRKCDGYAQLKRAYYAQVISYALDVSSTPSHGISVYAGFGDKIHYLQFYYHRIGPMLSGRFDAGLWSGIVLQMAHTEPAVRHAMIALAYLNQHGTGILDPARRYTATSHRSQFWRYYNRAVRNLVDRMGESSYTPEVGLVVCLLFICVEFLRADTQAAITHMKGGLNIISELRRGHTASPSMQHVRPARGSTKGPLDIIEKTLVPVFTQGLISAFLYGVDVDTDFAFLDTLHQHSPTHNFANIGEARCTYLSLRDATVLLSRDIAIKMSRKLLLSASDLQRQDQLLEWHRSWFEALLTLERSHKLSTEDTVAMNVLKVGYYTTYIASACVNDATQMSFDAHLDSFKALLVHAKVLVTDMYHTSFISHNPHPEAAAKFTFDIVLVPPLFYTALRCRCPITRREATALLSQNLPREGLWDPEKHRIVAEKVIATEEKDVDERGWPLERARLWNGAVMTDIDKDFESESGADFLLAKEDTAVRVLGAPRFMASSTSLTIGHGPTMPR